MVKGLKGGIKARFALNFSDATHVSAKYIGHHNGNEVKTGLNAELRGKKQKDMLAGMKVFGNCTSDAGR